MHAGGFGGQRRLCDGRERHLITRIDARFQLPQVQAELREAGMTSLLLVGEAAAGRVDPEAVAVCA